MKEKLKTLLAAAAGFLMLALGALTLPGLPSAASDEYILSAQNIPACSGSPYIEVMGGVPAFTEEMLAEATDSYESYSPLDLLGRPGTALSSVGRDLMPEGERGSIGMVKPPGFSTVRYDDLIEDKYLYNRCHLIGWQLTGENANEKNLITGTRYMNVDGMLPFENRIASYVKRTGNHVLYRVTPVYDGNDLVCRGLQMEAFSVEDNGEGISFHVFVYNVQPGIEIDYSNGESWRAPASNMPEYSNPENCTYVLNRNSQKFHLPSCESVSDMSEKNKIFSDEDRDTIVAKGYDPCKRCNP